MRLLGFLLAAATAQIYRPDDVRTNFSQTALRETSSHHISDGEHIKLEDGNLPSEIFLGRHVIRTPWTLGTYTNNVITVEDMYRVILKKKLHPEPVDFKDICHKDMPGTSLEAICGRKFSQQERSDRGPPAVPGILVRSTDNPCASPFRMVDGAHRICKRKAAGFARGCFFVLDEATALSLVVPAPARGSKAQRVKHIGRYEAIALGWKLAMDYYGIDPADCHRKNWTSS